MKKIDVALAVAAVLLFATQSACSAGSANPLIGKWELTKAGYTDRDGRTWCQNTEMLFTAASRTLWIEANPQRPAPQVSEKVIYLVSSGKVHVSNSDSFYGALSYSLLANVPGNNGDGGIMGTCPVN